MLSSWSITLLRTWATTDMMRVPPGLPDSIQGLRFLKAIIGLMVEITRFPRAGALAGLAAAWAAS